MAKIKLTKNELKVQKDALKMYQRYLPTLTLKKQQLQSEIRAIEANAKAVRQQKTELEKEFEEWIAVFSEEDVFPEGIITVCEYPERNREYCGRYDSDVRRGGFFQRGLRFV